MPPPIPWPPPMPPIPPPPMPPIPPPPMPPIPPPPIPPIPPPPMPMPPNPWARTGTAPKVAGRTTLIGSLPLFLKIKFASLASLPMKSTVRSPSSMAWNISTVLASAFRLLRLAGVLDSAAEDFTAFSGLSSPQRKGVAEEKAIAITKKLDSFRFITKPSNTNKIQKSSLSNIEKLRRTSKIWVLNRA